MVWYLFILSFFASSALAAVAKERVGMCSQNEFPCNDGACITLEHQCDGRTDCADGSDENVCYSSPNNLPFGNPVLNRSKRQASDCRKNKWQCRDGTCINFDGKCDGVVDCPDGSDETFPLCRNTPCQSNWFRCTYGACVDGTAPCNGVQECADNSDELLPKCRKEADEVRGLFKCLNGDTTPAANHCDGVPDCADGSDESVRACAAKSCPTYLFQCAYGACVDAGSDCNGKAECADGSDESGELCNRMGPGTSNGTNPNPTPATTGNCVLPAYPSHGRYLVSGAPNASPGQRFERVHLNYTCNPGYGVNEDSSILCVDGAWSSQSFPECVRFCVLKEHPSVEYRCIVNQNGVEGIRNCNAQEPTECGRITPEGEQLVIGGRLAKRGELPWHTGIYRKTTTPYLQICGGSLVSTSVVISAAHCFWDTLEERAQAASLFAVAVGKIYRPWNNPVDDSAQKSDVSEIKMPSRFQGAATNFQDDIAIMLLTSAFEYKTYVRPVCVDFDTNFDRRQLQDGKMAKVAGWGLVSENGNASQVLRVVDLPYVKIEECIAESPPGFREYITSDKICAGYRNGTALCKGDSGGGLVFPEWDKGVERYYLRGIVSTAPNNDNLCNAHTLTSFTQVIKHEEFIKEYLVYQ